ncbi:MAG: RTX toxin [Acidobacteriota bacterium]
MTPTRSAPRRPSPHHAFRLHVSRLIAVSAITLPASAQWVAEGPGPNTLGQVEGITDGEVVGAINVLAAHPSNDAIFYAGGVNGGIWKTTNMTDASPNWVRQTDDQESPSMGALEFDPTDGTSETLLAGFGLFSSFGGSGGSRAGLLRTTDGGATWTPITGMAERNISGVAPRGAVLVASVDTFASFTCSQLGIWRSTDTGDSWSQITAGIPRGRADALASDPTDATVLYTSIASADVCDSASNGIYRSADTGATWTKVSSAAMDALLTSSANTHVEIAVGLSGQVFVAIAPATTGQLGGVFRSPTGLVGTWTAMDLPTTFENTADVGVHPGNQGSIHMSIAADPTDTDIVYIGGDRQPLSFNDTFNFPNSIGAVDFSGRLFRGDAGMASGSQWTPLTHSGTASNSSPHADSRDMVFTAAGRLIESDDGGIYERTSPRTSTGDWLSKNGDIQTTEMHSTAHDRISDIILAGAQDTGTPQQITSGGTTWASVSTADGGDVAVDVTSTPGMSVRYSSFQNLGAFRRRTYDASNNLQSQMFPMLNVISGSALTVQFVTPVATNAVDGNRLIIGGGSVFESFDQGDTISEIGAGIFTLSPGRTIAYGATGNADILYVAACAGASCFSGGDDGIYVRSTAGGALSQVLSPSTNDLMRGVTVDPSNPAQAVAIDSSTVRWTTNTGGAWTNVTNNLAAYDTGTLRSVMYVERAAGDVVVVGADRGVYFAEADNDFAYWINLSQGLPNAPVYDLDHDPTSDQLTAGTLGRGAFSRTPSLADFLFADGFESNDTTRWDSQSPP